jgi:hypothetical protein
MFHLHFLLLYRTTWLYLFLERYPPSKKALWIYSMMPSEILLYLTDLNMEGLFGLE